MRAANRCRRPLRRHWYIASGVIVSVARVAPSAAAPLTAQQTSSVADRADAKTRAGILAFRDVTVIDVTDGRRLLGQTVVVAGNRIQAVGPTAAVAVPAGAQVVNAPGKYLLPGFWDMHAHVDARAGEFYPFFIAQGVTGIREMAQRWPNGPDSFRVWQREILAGARVGPRAIGPSADVNEGSGIQLTDPADAQRIVDSLKSAGDAFVKWHEGLVAPAELFFAVARAARRAGLPLDGHVPQWEDRAQGLRDATMLAKAADSGMRSIEHGNVFSACIVTATFWTSNDLDALRAPVLAGPDSAARAAQCAADAQAYLRNGTWLTPTLRAFAEKGYELGGISRENYVSVMRRLGVTRFLAGSDQADEGIGYAVLHEMLLLAEAGLSPLEVLQAATLNPAKFLNATDSLGTVAPGKLADLVLLDADPLTAMENVFKLSGVVANGRYFDRAALDSLDPEGVAAVRRFLTQPHGAAQEQALRALSR